MSEELYRYRTNDFEDIEACRFVRLKTYRGSGDINIRTGGHSITLPTRDARRLANELYRISDFADGKTPPGDMPREEAQP